MADATNTTNQVGGMDDVMKALMVEQYRTNIADVDLSSYVQEEYHNVACIIDSAQNISSQNFGIIFSGVKSYFIHKFIDRETVQKPFQIKSDAFFHGALYVDYICNAVLGSYDFIVHNNFSGKGLRELVEQSAGYFTKARRNAYYETHNFRPKPLSNLRHASFNSRLAAEILVDMTSSPEAKELYKKAEGIMDLKAVFFMDCIAQSSQNAAESLQKVEEQGFYKASLLAYASLYKSGADRIVGNLLGV